MLSRDSNDLASSARIVDKPVPGRDKLPGFISLLPENAFMLDVGFGNRPIWTEAISKCVPRLRADLLEGNLARYVTKENAFGGRLIDVDLRAYTPDRTYDLVWVRNVLFFLKKTELPAVMAKFANAVEPSGFLYFTMTDAHAEARANGLCSMKHEEIEAFAARHNFLCEITRDEENRFGPNDEIPLPMMLVTMRKKS